MATENIKPFLERQRLTNEEVRSRRDNKSWIAVALTQNDFTSLEMCYKWIMVPVNKQCMGKFQRTVIGKG